MNNIIQYDKIEDIAKYGWKEFLPFFAGIIFLCSGLIKLMLRIAIPAFTGREVIISYSLDFLLIALVILSYAATMSFQTYRIKIWPIYMCVAFAILWSLIFHPEYNEWFNHDEYGLSVCFLHMTSGFLALLYFSLFLQKDKLVTAVVFACRLNIVYYAFQYFEFLQRGYWEAYLGDGTLAELNYNLDYGYDVVVCAIAFLILTVTNRSKIDFALLIVSLFLVINAGSRGPLICIAAAVVLIYYFSWRISPPRSFKAFAMPCFVIALVIVGVITLPTIVNGLTVVLGRTNSSSRAIEMFLSGDFFNDSGRSNIYDIAFDMISKGPMGYGFYGDRFVIGRTWHYGYPHNIFLELVIQFGIVIGGIIIVILLYNIVLMLISCKDRTWQFLLITTFCSSIKLWLSGSFWYFWPFWALIAVLGLWKKEQRKKKEIDALLDIMCSEILIGLNDEDIK